MTSLVPVAPPARIERITTPQSRYLPRVESTVADLMAACTDRDGAITNSLVQTRLASLRRMLARSPYYQDSLREHAISPADLRSLGDLEHLPFLDRSTLQSRWPDLPVLDELDLEQRRLVAVRSSGSTGVPVTIVKDGFDAVYMWAALRFWCAFTGIALPPRPRATMLCSLPGGLEYSVRLPLLYRGALHRLSLLRDDAGQRLLRSRPSVVLTDPAGLHWLAALPQPPHPLLVLTSAQYLSPFQRERATAALGAPILNYYSSTETTQVAWECLLSPGRFHVLLPDQWVESVDGELVVTRLRPGLVPLVRYRTGDRGCVERDDCRCGYHGWTITGFAGRRACWFMREDGTEADAWQLAWLFKVHPLQDFRVTQTGIDQFAVEVAGLTAGGVALDDLRDRVSAALRNMGWAAPAVRIERVAAVDVPAGKPEPFRCCVRQAPQVPGRR